jgi:ubiquinol-cytochrome c reductase cytochrome c1 subunit
MPTIAFAATGEVKLEKAHNDINDRASLQEGAKLFVNYCMGCHSAQYVRFERVGKDLGIPEDELKENLMFTAEKVGETMTIALKKADALNWFGVVPPDLSVIARARGTDWLYTYLLSFYLDPSRPLGVNNLVLKDVNMPHALWDLQGWQKLVHETETDAEGHTHEVTKLELVDKDQMSEAEYQEKTEEYRNKVRNLVNFLEYIGEPAKLQRQDLGWKVIVFLIIFAIFAYLLKHEYWRDVH